MSVLIKGYMEVPENCANCPFQYGYDLKPFCTITSARLYSDDLYGSRRHELCPLVEVLVPHGDDVTNEALNAVTQYLLQENVVMDFNYKNKKYTLKVEEVNNIK